MVTCNESRSILSPVFRGEASLIFELSRDLIWTPPSSTASLLAQEVGNVG